MGFSCLGSWGVWEGLEGNPLLCWKRSHPSRGKEVKKEKP